MDNLLFFLFLFLLCIGFGGLLFSKKSLTMIWGFLVVMVTGSSQFFFMNLNIIALMLLLSTGIFASFFVVITGVEGKEFTLKAPLTSLFHFFMGLVLVFTFIMLFMAFIQGKPTIFHEVPHTLFRTCSPKVLGEIIFSDYALPFLLFSLIYMSAIMVVWQVLGHRKHRQDGKTYKDKLSRTANTITHKKIDHY